MKILINKEKSDDYTIEKYELNKVYAGQDSISIGVLILYLIANNPDIDFIKMISEADGDIGEERDIFIVEKDSFNNYYNELTILNDTFVTHGLKTWELKCKYHNKEINMSGHTFGISIGISYLSDNNVNMLPLLNKVENETWNYNNYDRLIVKKMIDWFNMSPKSVIQTLSGLEKYEDIYSEFIAGMQGESFSFKCDPISVEGYTARQLHAEYPLSEVGAYNYLKYLREDEEHALEDLKKGLPRY